MKMSYQKGFKYQLTEIITLDTPIYPPTSRVDWRYLDVDDSFRLTLHKGYAWDGCSGPTWDTDNTMIPGAFHDAGYWLGRNGYYKGVEEEAKKWWDAQFKNLLLDSDMWGIRAQYYYLGVSYFANKAFSPDSIKETFTVGL